MGCYIFLLPVVSSEVLKKKLMEIGVGGWVLEIWNPDRRGALTGWEIQLSGKGVGSKLCHKFGGCVHFFWNNPMQLTNNKGQYIVMFWFFLWVLSRTVSCESVLTWTLVFSLWKDWLSTHSGQTQKSNATSGFCRVELHKSLKRKPARLLYENVIKIVLWEKITSWEDFRMTITKCPGHMWSLKLNFSATVLTLGLKAKIFDNLRLLIWVCTCAGWLCPFNPLMPASNFLWLTPRSLACVFKNFLELAYCKHKNKPHAKWPCRHKIRFKDILYLKLNKWRANQYQQKKLDLLCKQWCVLNK